MAPRHAPMRSEAAQKVYDLYRANGLTMHSDLDTHYKCGRLGIRKPEPGRFTAIAAWEAGRDSA